MAAPAHCAPMAYPGMGIGLLGGSFNPAHAGHRHISQMALKQLGLDRIWWLVSPQNPLKDKPPALEKRLAGARSIARHKRIIVTGIEAHFGTRFTADTISALKTRYAGVHFVWLMGADNLGQIHQWHNWTHIFQSLPIAVFDRAGSSLNVLHSRGAIRFADARIDASDARGLVTMRPPAWVFLHTSLAPQSSTALRLSDTGEKGGQFDMG